MMPEAEKTVCTWPLVEMSASFQTVSVIRLLSEPDGFLKAKAVNDPKRQSITLCDTNAIPAAGAR
jgi:hypothetical protein